MLADLRTNAILAELPFTGVNFTQVLNSAGSFNGRLQISDLQEGNYDIKGVTIPARTSLYVDRDGVIVWGGIIWLRNYSSYNQTIEIVAREFPSYLERRRITTTRVFTNTDQLTIAQTLVNDAQLLPGGDIGLIVNSETSSVLVTRVYFDYEFKDLYSAIKDLSNASNGFDFNVDVAYDSFGEPQKYLMCEYPQRGVVYDATSADALVFEFPGNMTGYEWPDDGSATTNVMYGIGPNSNEAMIRAIAVAPAPQILSGWPLLEDTATYNDQYDPDLLYEQTLGEVTAKQNPIVTTKITIPAYASPVLGSYKTGDQCLLRITDDRFPMPSGGGFGLAVIKRIVSINVQPGEAGPETVTLTLADPQN